MIEGAGVEKEAGGVAGKGAFDGELHQITAGSLADHAGGEAEECQFDIGWFAKIEFEQSAGDSLAVQGVDFHLRGGEQGAQFRVAHVQAAEPQPGFADSPEQLAVEGWILAVETDDFHTGRNRDLDSLGGAHFEVGDDGGDSAGW